MNRLLPTLAVLVPLATLVAAQDFEKGYEAWMRSDFRAAMAEWRPLAEQGHAEAQYNLGILYEFGQGVPQDYATAIKWYRKAAKQDVPSAHHQLAIMYHRGRGLPQDYAKAVEWYRKAAEQNVRAAMHALGSIYRDGHQGVPQDYVKAHKWFNLAASYYDKAAAEKRSTIAEKMTLDEVREAQKLAREWMEKHGK